MSDLCLTKLVIGKADVRVLTPAPNSQPVTQIQQRVIFDTYVHHEVGGEAEIVRPKRGEILAMPLLVEDRLVVGLNARADGNSLHLTVTAADFDILVEHMLLTQKIMHSEQEGLTPSDQAAPPDERG